MLGAGVFRYGCAVKKQQLRDRQGADSSFFSYSEAIPLI